MMCLHILFLIFSQSSALADIFHGLKGIDRFQFLFQKIGHDIITASNGLAQRMSCLDQCFGVACPYICSMRQA